VAFLQARLGFGGAERLIQDLIRELRSAGWRALLFTLKDPGPLGQELASEGVTVVSGLARWPFDPWAGARLAAACRDAAVDVVYVTDSALPLFWAGQMRRLGPRPKLVVGSHTTNLRTGQLQHTLASLAAVPVVDAFIALAPGHRDYLARALDVPPERIEVIPNGVDLRRFAPPADRTALRRQLRLPEQARIVTQVAALRPEKNHAMFLGAAAAWAARIPDLVCLIVGDGPERAALERMAAIGKAPVRFLGARSDIPELVGASDVVTLCSQPVVETLPLSLIEALACGTPVVSTRVGSVADIVVEGETGLLVPPGDQAGFERAVATLLDDDDRRRRMSAAARADAVARFGRDPMIAAYQRLFGDLAAAEPAAAKVAS
jgi:glycosyltransferase involved in cell wall biosynthesis